MKLRDLLICTALMTLAAVNTDAALPPLLPSEVGPDLWKETGGTTVSRAAVPALPSALITEDSVLRAAYFDALSILSTTNRCSDFFGGTSGTVDIFNRFIAQVQKGYFSSDVGMKMSGDVTNVTNHTTKRNYRLFDKVSLNTNGPFYRKRTSNAEPSIPRIGNFDPNTKEIRVLILLHELGHVIKGANGGWLLPNDGNDEGMSLRNSQKIQEVCGEQIRNLGRPDIKNNLAIQNKAEQDLMLNGAAPNVTSPHKNN
jgi:hypothetical protein